MSIVSVVIKFAFCPLILLITTVKYMVFSRRPVLGGLFKIVAKLIFIIFAKKIKLEIYVVYLSHTYRSDY